MKTFAALRRASLAFEQRHNGAHRYSNRGGKPPDAALAASGDRLRVPETDTAPRPPLPKPEVGRYHLLRFIRHDQRLGLDGLRDRSALPVILEGGQDAALEAAGLELVRPGADGLLVEAQQLVDAGDGVDAFALEATGQALERDQQAAGEVALAVRRLVDVGGLRLRDCRLIGADERADLAEDQQRLTQLLGPMGGMLQTEVRMRPPLSDLARGRQAAERQAAIAGPRASRRVSRAVSLKATPSL